MKDVKYMRRMVKMALKKLEEGCPFPQDMKVVLKDYGPHMGRVLKTKIKAAL